MVSLYIFKEDFLPFLQPGPLNHGEVCLEVYIVVLSGNHQFRHKLQPNSEFGLPSKFTL